MSPHRVSTPLLRALLMSTLCLGAAAQGERRYFSEYDYPLDGPEDALYYVEVPLPENPDGPGYRYQAHYLENDALYAEGARSGPGKDGQWFGDWRYLYPDGQVKEKGHNDDQGRPDGDLISYFANGQVDEFKPYRAGKLEGVEKHYDDEGNLLIEIPYQDGARHGMQIAYYGGSGGTEGGPDGGQIQEERRYREGRYDDFYNRYARDGQRIGHAAYIAPGVFMAWTRYRDGGYARREATFQRDAQGRFRDDAPVWLRLIADHERDGTPRRVGLRYPQNNGEWLIGYDGDTVVRLEHRIQGVLQGPSIATRPGGREEGEMRDGQRSGTWRRYDDQSRLTAVQPFEQGQLHGEARERSGPDGQRWTYTHYDHGEQDGEWHSEDADGQVVESGQYRDGVPVGDWRTLEDQGQVVRAHYRDGQRHGDWSRHAADGSLLAERHYRNGEAQGVWKTYDENGELTARVHYRDGDRQGEMFEVEPDGHRILAHFKDDRLHGRYVESSPAGYPLLEGQYRDGLREGRFVKYNEEGQVERISPYRGGAANGEGWFRDRQGELVPARWEKGRLVEPGAP